MILTLFSIVSFHEHTTMANKEHTTTTTTHRKKRERITLGMNKNSRHNKESRYMLYKQFLSSYTSTTYKKS
jgi:hypothetical protein